MGDKKAKEIWFLCRQYSADEAMAIGLPGVYSAIPGIRERVNDGVDGFVVSPDDPSAITTRFRQLADSAELRRTMGVAARATAELRGRVETEAARYETLYLEFIR